MEKRNLSTNKEPVSSRPRRPLSNSTNRRKRRRQEETLVVMILGFVLLFVIAGGLLIYFLFGYIKASSEYDKLLKSYVDQPDTWEEAAVTGDSAEAILAPYPDLQIDFDALTEINRQFVAWIYVPGVDRSYPVVQAADNDRYLYTTFEGSRNSSGAIFMDYRDTADMSGFNTFIYGHNMKNGTMFGDLSNYAADESLIASYPYFYIYLPDKRVLKYQIFSYYNTDGNSDSYDRPEDTDTQSAYLNKITSRSVKKIQREDSDTGSFVTLSTCAGAAGSGQRFLIHGTLVETFNR